VRRIKSQPQDTLLSQVSELLRNIATHLFRYKLSNRMRYLLLWSSYLRDFLSYQPWCNRRNCEGARDEGYGFIFSQEHKNRQRDKWSKATGNLDDLLAEEAIPCFAIGVHVLEQGEQQELISTTKNCIQHWSAWEYNHCYPDLSRV
jgi:hypothetical protein